MNERYCRRCGKPTKGRNGVCGKCRHEAKVQNAEWKSKVMANEPQEYPCDNGCGFQRSEAGSCSGTCVKWDAWFRWKWRQIRKAAGIDE